MHHFLQFVKANLGSTIVQNQFGKVMKKQNPYALATLSLCIASTPIIANGDDHGAIVDEIVVTSSYVRSTQIEKHSLVVDGDTVNQGASQSLGELLDDYVGIATSDYGAAVGHPVIRGLSGDRIKIMANGLPVRDVSGIGADHLNEVDLSNVQQIEIAKGPSSILMADFKVFSMYVSNLSLTLKSEESEKSSEYMTSFQVLSLSNC